MRKISIIIVTYNSIDLIKDCIDSIFNYNDIQNEKLEVILVDNSDDDTSILLFDFVEKLYGERVILIKNKANLGYGHGNNLGIDAATGNIVCIMNPDVRFVEPLLQTVQNNFEKDSNLGLLGFKQLGGENLSFYIKPEFSYGIFTSIITKLANRFNFFNKYKFYISGAFMFLDKKKFIEIGKFDENIFMYFEEPDITKRLRDKNYNIKFDKFKEYLHLVGNRKEISNATLVMQKKSQDYYLDKYKIDKKKYYRSIKKEYQLKLFLSKIIGNQLKIKNLKNELKLLDGH